MKSIKIMIFVLIIAITKDASAMRFVTNALWKRGDLRMLTLSQPDTKSISTTNTTTNTITNTTTNTNTTINATTNTPISTTNTTISTTNTIINPTTSTTTNTTTSITTNTTTNTTKTTETHLLGIQQFSTKKIDETVDSIRGKLGEDEEIGSTTENAIVDSLSSQNKSRQLLTTDDQRRKRSPEPSNCCNPFLFGGRG